MKTSLKFLSLFFALSVPGALAAGFAGLTLPAGIDTLDAFCAFVIALVVMTAFGDYASAGRLPGARRVANARARFTPRAGKSEHALAA